MNRATWHQIANGTTARARSEQNRAGVLDMIDAAESAIDDANEGGAETFDAAAGVVARNLRGAYDARHLLGPADLLRLTFAVRRARRVLGTYANLPEEPTR